MRYARPVRTPPTQRFRGGETAVGLWRAVGSLAALAFALAPILAACAPADGDDPGVSYPLAPPGPGFHRADERILDADGRSVVLHGVNVANFAKYAPDILPWQSATDFEALAEQGFDTVRLLAFWSGIAPADGVIDDAYLDAYAARVGWAEAAGLLVVVDMHQDLFGVGFGEDGAPRWACDEALYASYEPQSPWYLGYFTPEVTTCFDHLYADDALFARFVEAWQALAARVASSPAVIAFDLLNEPWYGSHPWGAFVTSVWQPRLEELSLALHVVAPEKLLVWEGLTLSSLGISDPFVPPADGRTVFGPHYYHPDVHDGAAYESGMAAQIDWAVAGMATTAENLGGLPVWMGEFGGPTEVAGFDDYLEDLLERFAARRWGFSYYADDRATGGFAIRNDDGSFKAHVVERLGYAHARRVPGPASEQTLSFASGSYRLRFTWAYDAPLELWRGTGPAAAVELRALADGAPVACEQRAGAVPGVWQCAPPPPSALGKSYELQLTSP